MKALLSVLILFLLQGCFSQIINKSSKQPTEKACHDFNLASYKTNKQNEIIDSAIVNSFPLKNFSTDCSISISVTHLSSEPITLYTKRTLAWPEVYWNVNFLVNYQTLSTQTIKTHQQEVDISIPDKTTASIYEISRLLQEYTKASESCINNLGAQSFLFGSNSLSECQVAKSISQKLENEKSHLSLLSKLPLSPSGSVENAVVNEIIRHKEILRVKFLI